MLEALAVAAGGAVGSLGRWGIGRALTAACPGLPAGTFAANVAVCLVAVWAGTRLGGALAA